MLRISFILFFQLSALLIYAQTTKNDIIHRTDNTTVSGTILEITDDMVRYRKPNDATIYRLSTKDILKIVYANGDVEKYGKIENQTIGPKPSSTDTQRKDNNIASVLDSQPNKHTVWASLGVGGSIISSIPITFGYSYQVFPRISIVGSLQKAVFSSENGNWTYKYSSVGAGIRLFSKPSKLVNAKLKPFVEVGLGVIISTSIYSYDILGGSAKDTDIFPVPGFAVGCLVNTTPRHGAYGKMNLGPLSTTPLSLIDVGYTFRF